MVEKTRKFKENVSLLFFDQKAKPRIQIQDNRRCVDYISITHAGHMGAKTNLPEKISNFLAQAILASGAIKWLNIPVEEEDDLYYV